MKLPITPDQLRIGLHFTSVLSELMNRGNFIDILKIMIPDKPKHHYSYLMEKVMNCFGPMQSKLTAGVLLSKLKISALDQFFMIDYVRVDLGIDENLDGCETAEMWFISFLSAIWITRHAVNGMNSRVFRKIVQEEDEDEELAKKFDRFFNLGFDKYFLNVPDRVLQRLIGWANECRENLGKEIGIDPLSLIDFEEGIRLQKHFEKKLLTQV